MKKYSTVFLLFVCIQAFAQNNRDWGTYYGETGMDYGTSVAADAQGNVYLAGSTTSAANIASNGFQNVYGGNRDAFLLKLDAAGNRVWATYYGGTQSDGAYSLAVDAAGNIYMGGSTLSNTDIASGGFQNTYGGGGDAFLVKFDANGNRLWATYYGGSGQEAADDIAIDAEGNILITGSTMSNSGIAYNGFQNSINGSSDAFLVKFDPAGNRIWGTYYGGPGNDNELSVTTDSTGSIYIGGTTRSTSGITSGGFQNSYGGGITDAFLVKFDSTGNRTWASYYGGSGDESGNCVAVDPAGNVYFGGSTFSISAIAAFGFQNTFGGGSQDGFLVQFDTGGNRIRGTYYGGAGTDQILSMVIDQTGHVYVTGRTDSPGGIASAGFQNVFGGGGADGFLAAFSDSGTMNCATYYGGPGIDIPACVALGAEGHLYVAGQSNDSSGIASGGFQNTFGGGFTDAFLVKFFNCSPTSTGPEQAPLTHLIFPNPSAGTITIANAEGTVYIYDVFGQIVYSGTLRTGTNEINLEAQAPGLYFVEVLSEGTRSVSRVVIE